MARCPAHEDRQASLSVAEGDDGRVLLKCHAGCTIESICDALEIEPRDLFDRRDAFIERERPRQAATDDHPRSISAPRATEDQVAEWHQVLLASEETLDLLHELRGWTRDVIEKLQLGIVTPEQVAQLGFRNDGHRRIVFPIRNKDNALINLVLYAPRRRAATLKCIALKGCPRDFFPRPEDTSPDCPLWLLEGETDVPIAHVLGVEAVGVPGAAWKPTDENVLRFYRRNVVVCFDSDAPGRDAAMNVARAIAREAADVRMIDLDPARVDGYDLTDLVKDVGHEAALHHIQRLAEVAEPVTPEGLVLVSLDTMKREKIDWLIPGRVPLGKLTLLIGDPEAGKSLLTCLWAAQLSWGEIGNGDPGMTLIINAEDTAQDTVKPRLEAAGADLSMARVVTVNRDGIEESITIPDDLGELERAVQQTRAKLVVIDPINAHLPEKIDTYRDQSVRRALAPLARMAERQGCAVVVVGHKTKPKDDKKKEGGGRPGFLRAGGSVAFPGAARSVLELVDKEGTRTLTHIKCNVGPRQAPCKYRVHEILIPANDGQPEVKSAMLEEDE